MDRNVFMSRFFGKKKHDLTVADFDAYAKVDIDSAIERSKQLLGVTDEEITAFTPLILSFPESVFKENVSMKFVFSEDGLRYDIGRLNAVYFGEDRLYHYTVLVNHEHGMVYNDSALEVPYYYIKGVQTLNRFKLINDVHHHVLEMKILLDGMKSISIVLSDQIVTTATLDVAYELDEELLEFITSLKEFIRSRG